MISRLPEPELKLGNVKDPIKIQTKKNEAKQKQIEQMALNPLYGKVCCVCSYGDLELEDCSEDEEALLNDVFQKLIKYDHKIVTWNGIGFDIPFLYKRALLLRIKPQVTMSFWMKRFVVQPHCDLMQIWSNWSYSNFLSLNEAGLAILNTAKIDEDVTKFPELMKTQDGRDRIAEYCTSDCTLTWNLYNKFFGVLI
jgi:DNA polymerase elongation subunit (family B)